MGNRTIERSVARHLYTEFSQKWRREKRLAGQYGKPGVRKPTFSQWASMHERDLGMMAESSPVDVQEYLGQDPWAEPSPSKQEVDRGVVTVPISGDPI